MKMFYRTLYVFVMLVCFLTVQAAKRPFYLNVKNITCMALSSPMSNFHCTFKKLAQGRYLINANHRFDRDLPKTTMGQVQIQFRVPKGNKVVTFLNIKQDICTALKQANTLPLVRELMNEAFRSSNVPLACPLRANNWYNMTGFSVTDEYLPLYCPTVDFNYTLKYLDNKKLIGSLLLEGSTVRILK